MFCFSQTKKNNKFVTDSKTIGKIVVPGKAIKRPKSSKYIVFVQSTGTGARHLNANSKILYEV